MLPQKLVGDAAASILSSSRSFPNISTVENYQGIITAPSAKCTRISSMFRQIEIKWDPIYLLNSQIEVLSSPEELKSKPGLEFTCLP
jgi:hypothetical protein